MLIGGSAVPESLIRAFHDEFGVDVIQGWGMTETSPIGTLSNPPAALVGASLDEQMPLRLKQGTPPLGVELTVKDEAGAALPHDGRSPGRLMVRGPAVAGAYFGREEAILDGEGWFDTGDVATIDPAGVMQITDRAKDVIKSGGEWISSIEIENIAVGHADVVVAAVIGAPHPKWDERPVLVVQLKPGAAEDRATHLAWLDGKIAKWWTPDDVVFVAEVPLGVTGKVDKRRLRALLADYALPETRR